MRTHILGFPSIGKQRELKQVLEAFWKGDLAAEALAETCTALKKRHWRIQQDAGLDSVTTGDFSLYDRMLDITRMLGAMPPRFAPCLKDAHPDLYFSLARGDARRNIPALEMTPTTTILCQKSMPIRPGIAKSTRWSRIQGWPGNSAFRRNRP